MEYIDIVWHHNNSNDPIRLVSELDENRYELRKLEFYKSGNVGFASENKSNLNTMLGEKPVPSLQEIITQEEFSGKSISENEFEQLWCLRTQ